MKFIFRQAFLILVVNQNLVMWYYVYNLEMKTGKHYVGCTVNVKERFSRHKKGYVTSTKPHLPVKLVWCCSFPDRYKAYEFEHYLKSGSGRAFAIKHLF